ncbi:MFS transporter [Streptomyces yunnanensis]|uniref:Drug resistance transporter, EmrB/QacA subfamily n=1 Tax=Streptomyces yunnanensis TaxID=156453 RepID=A0A9X8QSQ1_9ACTN|nr:MFS transporter [Streptomyces yunnanensis]SHL81694.1 drug resistance transporter, EmrB/QacA subfamily [Streptomyces yunnanensis]
MPVRRARPVQPVRPVRNGALLALACLVMFLIVLDATIVSVALPSLRADLGIGPTALPWVVNAYTLSFAGFLLVGGRCGDLYGRRRTLLIGISLFTLASAVGGLATEPGPLLIARATQGLGGALLMPTTLSVIIQTFPEGPQRARALAVWSAVGAVGAASGTVLGGVLTQLLDWRWVFLINLPFGAVAATTAWRVLFDARRDVPAEEQRREGGELAPRQRLDLPGAMLVTAGLAAALYGLMESTAYGWAAPRVWGPVAAGAIMLALFAVHQARWAKQPLVSPSVVRRRPVQVANATMFLLGLAFFASPVLVSLHLQNVHHYSPLRAGLGFLPTAVALMVSGLVTGRLIPRFGARAVAVGGLTLAAAGFGALALTLGGHGPYALTVGLPGVVFGLGVGSAFTPVTACATSGVSPSLAGVAAGILNTTRQVSGAVGLAVLSTLAATGADSYARSHPAAGGATGADALAHGNALAFGVAACCALASAVVATRLPPPQP